MHFTCINGAIEMRRLAGGGASSIHGASVVGAGGGRIGATTSLSNKLEDKPPDLNVKVGSPPSSLFVYHLTMEV
jgi:hypothetical protein